MLSVQNLVWGLAGFLVGFTLGVFTSKQILIPIGFNLPHSIARARQGRLEWRAAPYALLEPLIWGALFGLVAYLGQGQIPVLARFLESHEWFRYGGVAGYLFLLSALFTPRGRRMLREDFDAGFSRFALAARPKGPKRDR